MANNIAQLRKSKGLTQLELAERLNYSDKAVSKWERGEGLPDVLVLSKMAEIFDVTLAELVDGKTKKPLSPANKKRALIAAAASLLVWVVATIVFVVLRLLPEPPDKAWLAFIYALPATMIVLTVFSVVWKMRLFVFCAVSLLIWTMCLTLFCQHNFRYRQRLAAVHNRHSPANTQHSVVLPFKKIKNPFSFEEGFLNQIIFLSVRAP